MIQERRKFGPLGWNIVYEFSDSDLIASITMLKNFLLENDEIPWDALKFMTGSINYGGNVTDEFDRILLLNILNIFQNDEIVSIPNYKFSKKGTYILPEHDKIAQIRMHIEKMPNQDEPEIFGMHPNANIAYLRSESQKLLDTVLNVQPREQQSSSGDSPEKLILDLIERLLGQVPDAISKDMFAKEIMKINTQGLLHCLSTVLIQEVWRYNHLLSEITSSLSQLNDAILGKINMSAVLDAMHTDLMNNRVPVNWKFVSYAAVGRYQQCEMSFGSMPSGPAVSGTCFFAFVSKKHGEPPSIPAIQFFLNRARFEAHARIVLFLAVNTVVLDFLHSIPELAVIASFPTHTVHLECPAVWRYGKSKKTSKYPFALCVWQSRGFCKLNESDKKLTERALLRAGILQVSRKAQFHRDEFDRIWLGLKDEVPFAEPKSRSQSLFLLSAVEEEQICALGIRGKALSQLIKTMRHGLIDYHVEKWLPCCPKEILRIRNLNTRKRSAPRGKSEMGECAF